MKTKKELFQTYDLGCVAALLSKYGYKLVDIKRDNPRKALFIIEGRQSIMDEANQYFENTLQVPARKYFDELKALKNRLYSSL